MITSRVKSRSTAAKVAADKIGKKKVAVSFRLATIVKQATHSFAEASASFTGLTLRTIATVKATAGAFTGSSVALLADTLTQAKKVEVMVPFSEPRLAEEYTATFLAKSLRVVTSMATTITLVVVEPEAAMSVSLAKFKQWAFALASFELFVELLREKVLTNDPPLASEPLQAAQLASVVHSYGKGK